MILKTGTKLEDSGDETNLQDLLLSFYKIYKTNLLHDWSYLVQMILKPGTILEDSKGEITR